MVDIVYANDAFEAVKGPTARKGIGKPRKEKGIVRSDHQLCDSSESASMDERIDFRCWSRLLFFGIQKLLVVGTVVVIVVVAVRETIKKYSLYGEML